MKILEEYVSGLSDNQKTAVRDLFELSFNKFSKMHDKLLVRNCSALDINPERLQAYLQKENDVAKAISALYLAEEGQHNL